MKNKKKIILIICLIPVCLLCLYEARLYSIGNPFPEVFIKWSQAKCFFEPEFEITADNFEQTMQAYFSAPSRLYYSVAETPECSINRKCDFPPANARFGKMFREIKVKECTVKDIPAKSTWDICRYSLVNGCTELYLYFYKDKTFFYICYGDIKTNSVKHSYFYSEENLFEEYKDIVKEIRPFSMEVEDITELEAF